MTFAIKRLLPRTFHCRHLWADMLPKRYLGLMGLSFALNAHQSTAFSTPITSIPQTAAFVTKSGIPVCSYALGGAAGSVQPASLISEYAELVTTSSGPSVAPFLFYYNPHRYPEFMSGVTSLCEGGGTRSSAMRREDLFIASGGTDRTQSGMERRLVDALARCGGSYLNMFVLEYVLPEEISEMGSGDGDAVGPDLARAVEIARSWVDAGRVRHVCASTHSHAVGAALASVPEIDALMLRYGLSHRSAAEGVSLPAAADAGKPVLAFTTTRWNALQGGHRGWGDAPPATADCLSFALSAFDGVEVVLHSARDGAELREAMAGIRTDMSEVELERWRAYGDLEWNMKDGFDEYPEEGLSGMNPDR